MTHVRRSLHALCGVVLWLGAVAVVHAQDHTAQGQRIRLQFKDSATYRDTKEVEVKTAVMIRGVSNDSSSREARIRILLSNLESNLCDTAKAVTDLVSPIALTGDADFVLEFSMERSSKKDIAEVDLYRVFFASGVAVETAWLGTYRDWNLDKLFPGKGLHFSNADLIITEVIPGGAAGQKPMRVVLERKTIMGMLYHNAVKRQPLSITPSRGYTLVSREQDAARINFHVEPPPRLGGLGAPKVAADGNLALRLCPNIVTVNATK